MCEQIVKFCSGSVKPLLYAGGFFTLNLAFIIGYVGHYQHSIFKDIDGLVAEEKSLLYYLQLLAAVYLFLFGQITGFLAFYNNKKHLIRLMVVISSINFVLAAAAILMVPPGTQLGSLFSERLKNATSLYDLTDKPQPSSNGLSEDLAANITHQANDDSNSNGQLLPVVNPKPAGSNGNSQISEPNKPSSLTNVEATKIWDALQNRGCCGYQNATLEWKKGIPKSCCAQPETNNSSKVVCKEVDQQHARTCLNLIESTSSSLLIVLTLIALVNLYLATVFGLNTLWTFHYNEANQNAYT